MARVLVVEDDLIVAQMLEMILTYDNHTVFIACDGQQGMDVARQTHPDVILMDIMLPLVSGIDAAASLRASGNPVLETTPIIAMSSSANLMRLAGSGLFCGVLPKPFDVDAVNAAIKAALTMQFREAA